MRYQTTHNIPLANQYHKVLVKIEASHAIINQLVCGETYNITTVYLDQVNKELTVPSAYHARKNVLELIIYLKSEYNLMNRFETSATIIHALISLLDKLKVDLLDLHKMQNRIPIQNLS